MQPPHMKHLETGSQTCHGAYRSSHDSTNFVTTAATDTSHITMIMDSVNSNNYLALD
jgi:hypothetical protein